MKKYGHLTVNRPKIKGKSIVTFQEFVKWVIDTDPDEMNSHWKPIYKCCSFCARKYDFILRYENLALETQQLLKYFKWDHIIPPSVRKHLEF